MNITNTIQKIATVGGDTLRNALGVTAAIVLPGVIGYPVTYGEIQQAMDTYDSFRYPDDKNKTI